MNLGIRFYISCAAAIAAICPLNAQAFINVKDPITIGGITYPGAVGDGIADDTAPINRAIHADTAVYFPPGTYSYTGLMTLPTNTSYRLYGDGPGVSTILFTGNPNAGIYAPKIGPNTLNVEGLTLKANSNGCGTAILAKFSEPDSGFTGRNTKFHTATIHNVQILGPTRDGFTGSYWTGGIYLYKAQNSVIDKVEISGNTGVTQTGIVWESSVDYASTGLQLSNLEIKFVNTALRTNGWVEGLYMTGFEFVLCGKNSMPAIDLNSNSSTFLTPAFHLVNGHVNCIEDGVRVTNLTQIKISNVNFAHASAAAVNGTILTFNNCVDVVVSECSFYGVDSNVAQENGISLDNAHSVRIAGNSFSHMLPQNGNCIVVLSNSNVVRITDNLFSSVRNRYLDQGPDTYYWGNN